MMMIVTAAGRRLNIYAPFSKNINPGAPGAAQRGAKLVMTKTKKNPSGTDFQRGCFL